MQSQVSNESEFSLEFYILNSQEVKLKLGQTGEYFSNINPTSLFATISTTESDQQFTFDAKEKLGMKAAIRFEVLPETDFKTLACF